MKPVVIIDLKDTVFKKGKEEAIKEISTKLGNIEKKSDEVYGKLKRKRG